jgi:hypothetical protein
MSKQSSAEISSLAGRVMNMRRIRDDESPAVPAEKYNRLLKMAQKLAASVLSQDETKGQENG